MESPVLSSAQMHAAEESAFARGVSVETLMDQAGAGVARAVRQFFPKPATCIVFAGKGHNGGDALVAAEQLQRTGWKIDIRLPFPEETCSELMQKKLKALRHTAPKSSDTVERAPPLVPRHRRIEIAERLDADGNVLVPLDEDAVARAAATLKEDGVEAVAVGFLHAYRNDIHERRAGEILRRLMPDPFVALSSQVLPEFREYERLSTTVINAYAGMAG